MYSIVSNSYNSIDVDKFDYLLRDAFNIGLKIVHFDIGNLIDFSRVISNQLCYNYDVKHNFRI